VASVALLAFDLDDTLYPERAFVRSGFRVVSEYLEREGLVDHPVWPDLVTRFESGVRDRAFNRVLLAAGVVPSPGLIRTLVEMYRSHRLPEGPVQPDIQLYADAERALARLRLAGLKLGLITDGPLAAQLLKVDALGMEERLDAIILTDQWGRDFWKPHPRAFREMASRLEVDPASCVYVGDNPEKDFDGPAAAGWGPSIRIRRQEGLYNDATPSSRMGPVAAVISDLDMLDAVIAAFRPPDAI
jgi:putative hydrolase of the HAD superfamily